MGTPFDYKGAAGLLAVNFSNDAARGENTFATIVRRYEKEKR